MKDLSQEEWTAQLEQDENAVILDVRTPAEVDEGIIPEATVIDFYEGAAFVEKIKELDPAKNYYVYCRSGQRSGQSCQIMSQLGFENTYNLLGGFMNWDGEVAYLD